MLIFSFAQVRSEQIYHLLRYKIKLTAKKKQLIGLVSDTHFD